MATGVWSWDTTAANNSNADSTINWAEGQDSSTVNNSARAEMAGVAKYLLDTHGALTTTGAANTYSVTTNSTRAAYADGQGLSLVINASSTGASTLNVDAVGAKAIRKITSAGEAAIGTGDMIAAGHYIFEYDESANTAAGAWILLNPTPSGADVVDDTTPQLGGMLDVNGFGIGNGTDEIVKFTEATTPVNEITLGNADTGAGPTISATGDDTNIDMLLVPKGSGVTKSGGNAVLTAGDLNLNSLNGLTLAQGDVLYATGVNTLAKLAKGTAAQNLVMNSGATAPEWADASSGGFTDLVAGTALSGQASVDITGLTGYKIIRLFVQQASPSADNTEMQLLCSDDNGSTFETTGYRASKSATTEAALNVNTLFDAADTMDLFVEVKLLAGNEVQIMAMSNNNNFKYSTFDNGNAVTALRLQVSTGTFDAGTLHVEAQ